MQPHLQSWGAQSNNEPSQVALIEIPFKSQHFVKELMQLSNFFSNIIYVAWGKCLSSWPSKTITGCHVVHQLPIRKEASTKCRHHPMCWLSVTELHLIWAHWHQEFWWWLWQGVTSKSEYNCVELNWSTLSETNSFDVLKTAVLGGDKSSLKVPALLCLLQMNCLRLRISQAWQQVE